MIAVFSYLSILIAKAILLKQGLRRSIPKVCIICHIIAKAILLKQGLRHLRR